MIFINANANKFNNLFDSIPLYKLGVKDCTFLDSLKRFKAP